MRRLCSLLFLALALAACAGAEAPTAPAADRPPLKVAWIPWPGWYPMVIAQEKGIFAKHGVKVEGKLYTSYADIPADFAAGKLDGGFAGLYDILPLPNIQDVQVVLITDTSDGAEGLIATADVADIAAIKGKRVGVTPGAGGEFYLRYVLRENGLTINDVSLVGIDAEAVPGALGDTIDVGYTWEPHVSQAAAKGNKLLISTADTPGLIPDIVYFRSAVLRERPEDARAFIDAWFEAQQYWQDNPAESNALIAKAIGLTPAEISPVGAKLFDRKANQDAFKPGSDNNSLYHIGQLQIDFLKSTGTMRTIPDINQLLNPSFLMQP
ncbi:MAG TPA: ABC transporter substrate-binding protein [Herpetosiphonaceae bacterium]